MKTWDAVTTLGRSRIQHGPHSDRVYLMRLHPADYPGVVGDMGHLADEQGYSKIFAKVPSSLAGAFFDAGYVVEARIPGFFPSREGTAREDGLFLARFLAEWRSRDQDPGRVLDTLRTAVAKVPPSNSENTAGIAPAIPLGPEDAEEMAAIYRTVFESYPFPIFDPAYIRETMASHTTYYGLRRDGRLAALAACEVDEPLGQAEMTDFAVPPQMRGANAAFRLLGAMERDMRRRSLHAAYTIARARSFPMNIAFARRGYGYAGALMRNTNISGSLETMHVWCKTLKPILPNNRG